jgi:hypothetical protein
MRGATLSVVLVVLPALAVAQARPDAGVGVGVGVARPADAGVAEAARPAPAAASGESELARLRREVVELKALVERQVAQSEAVDRSLARLGAQVGRLQTDFADAEQRRADAAQQAAARRQATGQAVVNLAYAQQALASGSTDISGALSLAEGAFTGAAQQAVQRARAALANSDLNATRYWLAIAAAEAANNRD